MGALDPPAFERQGVVGAFPWYAEFRAGRLPLRAVGIDAPPAAALVGDEVCKLVLERPPGLLVRDLADLGVQLDAAVRPPCAAGGGAHPRVP